MQYGQHAKSLLPKLTLDVLFNNKQVNLEL